MRVLYHFCCRQSHSSVQRRLSWLSVMRGFTVFMTISMIGAGAGSSTTDQIIANNKHSLGRNFEEGRW